MTDTKEKELPLMSIKGYAETHEEVIRMSEKAENLKYCKFCRNFIGCVKDKCVALNRAKELLET